MSKIEKTVIIFLVSTLFTGIGVSYYKKTHLSNIRIVSPDESSESTAIHNTMLEKKMVNINTADKLMLETLPGVGPALAKRIVDSRREKGLFSSPPDIMRVKGIGQHKYQSMKELIRIDE
ncbi:ComEA family DNA-binding protein [Candidatus Omnitrophota bacterium]